MVSAKAVVSPLVWSATGAARLLRGPTATEFGRIPPLCEEAALIAAFKMCAKGGLMPHARQGGTGEDEVAVPASKLVGTGFENEQIGQTHVADACLGGVGDTDGTKGLLARDTGEDAKGE